MRADDSSRQIAGLAHRAVFAHEHAVSFHRRLPFRAQADNRRPGQFAAQEVRKVEIGNLHIAANQRVLLFMTRRVRQFNDFHCKAVRPDDPLGQRIVSSIHAETITIMGKRELHRAPHALATSSFFRLTISSAAMAYTLVQLTMFSIPTPRRTPLGESHSAPALVSVGSTRWVPKPGP